MSSSDSDVSNPAGPDGSKRGVKRKRDNIPTTKVAKTKKVTLGRSVTSDSSSDDSDSDAEEKEEDTLEEVHILSHAAQRKLKRKEQKEAKGKEESPPVAESAPKRQNSVWVGNLAFKTTEQSLRGFFSRDIPGCDVTRINLPMKTGKDVGGGRGMRGENRGFAYVDFRTKEVKEQAIALSEQNLDGRKLLIKDGGDFTGRPTVEAKAGVFPGSAIGKSRTAQRILAAQKQPPAPTLFLGNLGFQATESSIRGMLEGHMKPHQQEGSKDNSLKEATSGKAHEVADGRKWLRNVRLGTFEDSGLCKGWAFVDFFNIEDATMVLIDPRNHHLDGRKLVVEYASADAVRRGGGPGAKAHRDTKETSQGKGGVRQTGEQDGGESKGIRTEENMEKQDEPPQKRIKVRDKEHGMRGGKAKRTKPGAALAMAKREQVAIVPSSGKKIVF